jgi:hypothetical protein
MTKLQFLFDIIFATVLIAFVHFLAVMFSPGPMAPELRAILDWFTH